MILLVATFLVVIANGLVWKLSELAAAAVDCVAYVATVALYHVSDHYADWAVQRPMRQDVVEVVRMVL